MLKEARTMVVRAAATFEGYQHAHYAAGAYLELALIDLARKDLQGVVNDLEAMEGQIKTMLAAGYDDQRLACSAAIIKSRLERHRENPVDAEKHAGEALDIAKRNEQRLATIDALIARGEALFEYGKSAQDRLALKDLDSALELNKGKDVYSPKIEGSCRLHLARHYASRQNLPTALEHFQKWKSVARQVEHAALHASAKRIEAELPKASTTLLIDATTSLNYDQQLETLERFLLGLASRATDSPTGKARLLGMKRQSFQKHKWPE
jgi:tetratricopeptide (TPR) repeat protein